MNLLGFKRLVIAIIDRVLGQQPEPRQQAPRLTWLEHQESLDQQARQRRPSTGRAHKYFGDGLHGRYGNLTPAGRHGKQIDRQFRSR